MARAALRAGTLSLEVGRAVRCKGLANQKSFDDGEERVRCGLFGDQLLLWASLLDERERRHHRVCWKNAAAAAAVAVGDGGGAWVVECVVLLMRVLSRVCDSLFLLVKNRSSERESFGERVCKCWEWGVVKVNVGDEGGGSTQAVKQSGVER